MTMNNINGAALLERIRAGDLVTIRTARGHTVTGRARVYADTAGFAVETCNGRGVGVNAGNIINVRPAMAAKD